MSEIIRRCRRMVNHCFEVSQTNPGTAESPWIARRRNQENERIATTNSWILSNFRKILQNVMTAMCCKNFAYQISLCLRSENFHTLLLEILKMDLLIVCEIKIYLLRPQLVCWNENHITCFGYLKKDSKIYEIQFCWERGIKLLSLAS